MGDIIGASDAGAHLDMIDTFAFSTQVLGNGVRQHGVISLEQAIHQMTQVAAEAFGLVDRGVLKPGWNADVVVLDPCATPLLEARHALSRSLDDVLFALMILGDDRAVRATYVSGRRCRSAPSP